MLHNDHSYLCGKHSYYSKAILGDLNKHFYHELPESFPDNRLILLERRRATLSRQCKYKTSKCSEFNLQDKETLLLSIVQWNVLMQYFMYVH